MTKQGGKFFTWLIYRHSNNSLYYLRIEVGILLPYSFSRCTRIRSHVANPVLVDLTTPVRQNPFKHSRPSGGVKYFIQATLSIGDPISMDLCDKSQ